MAAHHLLGPETNFIEEDEAAALGRYNGFASDFFVRLYAAIPVFRGCFRFYCEPKRDDLYAVCEATSPRFALLLIPHTGEQICLWDENKYHEEMGYWNDDPVGYTIQKIQERYPPSL